MNFYAVTSELKMEVRRFQIQPNYRYNQLLVGCITIILP